MVVGINEILIALGTVISIWIINNYKLKEGITSWFVERLGIDTYDIKNHNIKETLKKIILESKLTEFDNDLKTELYHYYIYIVISHMHLLIIDIIDKQKTLSLEETKKIVKNTLYDKLHEIEKDIDHTIKLPNVLQDKFDKFRNYLSLQHTYAVENALQSSNKKLLLIQVLDAIDNNSRWFLFYTTEMFESFNGHFEVLKRKDVFIKH